MKVLCIGDVVSDLGVDIFCRRIPALKRELLADICIVNGENADTSGKGITKQLAADLFSHGADVITGGNHSLQRASEELFDSTQALLMPANYPSLSPLAGCCELDFGRYSVFVASLLGNGYGGGLDNPFYKIDELLKGTSARFKIIDFHAESSAEKKALAYYLDGRASAVFGTHTHVPTADEQILPRGTGYITDIGMTGCDKSVIGVTPADAITKQKTQRPVKFTCATGAASISGALFELNDETGMCKSVARVRLCE